ncbi:hypothetical protein CDAR_33191 [Caerostris darwini]|uniref:Uncharacterized protein n=1 Tax=Caerostris darwini TaxID=1538125 RepID=A0AAV4X5S1_9ARAC|nr:hypothetical protein CDAR_33191 [Caerostris darwini]
MFQGKSFQKTYFYKFAFGKSTSIDSFAMAFLFTHSVYSSVNTHLLITSAKEKSPENWPPTFAFTRRCLPTRIMHRRIMNSGAFALPPKSCSSHTT